MKKHITTLLLTALVSIGLISCDGINFYTNEGTDRDVVGFKYEFNSDRLKLSVDDDDPRCKVFYVVDSPVYKQYIYHSSYYRDIPTFRVDSLSSGDTLTIYCYATHFGMNDPEVIQDKIDYFRRYHRSPRDSVVIVGPSPIYQYRLEDWGDTLSLTEVNSLCP